MFLDFLENLKVNVKVTIKFKLFKANLPLLRPCFFVNFLKSQLFVTGLYNLTEKLKKMKKFT
jgi:hypothetical protein